MRRFIFKPLFLVFSFAVLVSSCSSDDDLVNNADEPQGAYDSGFIFSNEGNFGSPSASVSFVSNDLGTIENTIFSSANNDANLGDVLNSIAFDDDYAYLVVNNSNKVLVVNRYNFELVATLTEGIDLPRYAAEEEGKLYISNSGDKTIAVYNTDDFTLDTNISIDKAVEQLIVENGYLYVQNAAFNTGSDITVVNLNDNQIEKTITVGEGLNSIAIEGDVLYALYGGGVKKISTTDNTVSGSIPFDYVEGFSGASKLEVEEGQLYFIAGSKVYKFSATATKMEDKPLFDTQVSDESYFIGYGFSVENDKIFYSNVNGFTADAQVSIYDLEGNLQKTVTTGIGTNNVYFND